MRRDCEKVKGKMAYLVMQITPVHVRLTHRAVLRREQEIKESFHKFTSMPAPKSHRCFSLHFDFVPY